MVFDAVACHTALHGSPTDPDPSSLENLGSFMLEIFGPKTVPDSVVKYNSTEQKSLALWKERGFEKAKPLKSES